MQTEEMGFFHDDWLAALAGRAADDLRAAVASGAEWQGLWHFLHGLAAMTPSISTSSGVPDLPTAVRRACATAHDAIAGAGLAPPGPVDTGPAQPAGDPVMLTDGYGSRFALIAPFAWGTEDRHWYSWDIDQCGTDNAVAAGVHDSLEAAVTEWRAAVGVAAASAEPTSCDLATAERLLTSAVPSGPFGAMLLEFESPEFTAEQFRLRQRALALLTRPPAVGDRSLPDVPVLVEDFMTWLGKRGGLVPDRQDASTLAYEWAMTPPPGYYACSPHRIKHAVILLTDSYETKYAEAALDVLPAWVEWCIERSRLSGELAGRSRAAAKRNRWDGRETERIRVLE
ncbi:hypothetical protein [Herbidospora yilanensis]|uniref:hypothetical protein n=1 Tax=Herbidospora yilanensis TaxID=354426 RepID=UPI0007841D62|nr:hypothetical protein [Herbidospora yilanensis]